MALFGNQIVCFLGNRSNLGVAVAGNIDLYIGAGNQTGVFRSVNGEILIIESHDVETQTVNGVGTVGNRIAD